MRSSNIIPLKNIKKYKTVVLPTSLLFVFLLLLVYVPTNIWNNYYQLMKESDVTLKLNKQIFTLTVLSEMSTSPNNLIEETFMMTNKLYENIDVQIHRNLSELHSEPKRGENPIIFLETSCVLGSSTSDSSSRGFILKPRSACAVESAAKTNPGRNIYVIYSCPIVGEIEQSDNHVKHVLNLKNIKLWFLDVPSYFKYTPLENWGFYKKVNSSKWPLSHASDVLRYLSLWKYGGTYLDMDFVFIRALEGLGSNYVGAQADKYLASGALDFSSEGIGQMVAHLCIRQLQKNFRGDIWGRNGPDVITNVLKNICGAEEITHMTQEACLGFRIYPPSIFYQIPYPQYNKFFDENSRNETFQRLAESYSVHIWNKFSVSKNVTVGSKQPYGLLANKFCPAVYNNIGPIF